MHTKVKHYIAKTMAFQLVNQSAFGSIALVFVLSIIVGSTSAHSIFPHPLSKHSFTEVSKCSGAYDMTIYAKLDGICKDCFNIYREPEIYRGCR